MEKEVMGFKLYDRKCLFCSGVFWVVAESSHFYCSRVCHQFHTGDRSSFLDVKRESLRVKNKNRRLAKFRKKKVINYDAKNIK